MELRNLRTFQQVAERNSFTAAAASLGYSQSTVSFQIRQLEEELDCLLFDRINHTLRLTEQGRALLDYAQTVLHLTEEFRQSMDTSTVPEGSVHIMAPDSLCESILLSHLADFYKKYPQISLKFSTGDTVDMFRMLNRNEVDVILTLDTHMFSRDYVILREERVNMHFVTGTSSPYAGRKALSIGDLLEEPFVLTERGMGYGRLLHRELEKRSLELRPVLELGRTDLITAILSKGVGISFLPDFVTAEAVAKGELVYLDVADVEVEVWKQLVCHRNKWISRGLRVFLDYIIEAEFSDPASRRQIAHYTAEEVQALPL
ncbi:MAG: LysR family transcriptional regulator [Oscillospiraceae bacterium]|nr:LysR family transcriptional regulator [Oscillospiraceae bacterium]